MLLVKAITSIKHNGRLYSPGAAIEVKRTVAEYLVTSNAAIIEHEAETDLNKFKISELKKRCIKLDIDTAGAKVKQDYIDLLAEKSE